MAVGHGLQGVLKISTSTVLQVQNIKVGTKIELVSKAVMGDTDETSLTGLRSGTITADALYDPADTTGQEAMTVGAAATLIVNPQGTTTGKKNLSVPVIIESVDIDIPMNGAVKRSFGARINGPVTPGTN